MFPREKWKKNTLALPLTKQLMEWFQNIIAYYSTFPVVIFILNQIGTSTGVIEDTETEVGKYVARVDLGRFSN